MYKRVLLKISGESLGSVGGVGSCLNMESMDRIASGIVDLHVSGVQVAVVVGGGNVLRGASFAQSGIDRAAADYMGMLATVINALAVQSVIEKRGIECRVLSALPMNALCEQYIRRRGLHHISKGRVVVFAGGTGNPFFSTDTAAVLRAIEMECDAVIKGTHVDGVYSSDPKSNANASRYQRITYKDVLSNDLRVMDSAAIALAKDNKLPVVVFDLNTENSIMNVINGLGNFTVISD